MKKNMKYLFLFLLITGIFFSCIKNEKLANDAIYAIDSAGIDLFKNWEYKAVGHVSVWYRATNNDYYLYSCQLLVYPDSSIIRITKFDPFLRDWKINFESDLPYSIYHLVQFNDCTLVRAIDDQNNFKILKTVYNKNYLSFYTQKNPFAELKRMTQLVDRLGITSTTNYPKFGGFIQFNICNQYILTYLPNQIDRDSAYQNSGWNLEIEKGKMIRKNWSLRKIEIND